MGIKGQASSRHISKGMQPHVISCSYLNIVTAYDCIGKKRSHPTAQNISCVTFERAGQRPTKRSDRMSSCYGREGAYSDRYNMTSSTDSYVLYLYTMRARPIQGPYPLIPESSTLLRQSKFWNSQFQNSNYSTEVM
jgi:hypothetical protein